MFSGGIVDTEQERRGRTLLLASVGGEESNLCLEVFQQLWYRSREVWFNTQTQNHM